MIPVRLQRPTAKAVSKYGSKKVVVDGLKFDSMAESRRWLQLKRLEAGGKIQDLRHQPAFILVPSVKFAGAKARKPAVKYIADFCYQQAGVTVVEDVKSPSTAKLPTFQLKRHLMLHVLGLDVTIISGAQVPRMERIAA